jgi:hypothetical protein
MLYASGRVVEGFDTNVLLVGQELSTLVECDWMRNYTPDVFEFHARCGNQVVFDPQTVFGDDVKARGEEQIEVFAYGSGKRVFDWKHDGVRSTIAHRREYFTGHRARNHFRAWDHL